MSTPLLRRRARPLNGTSVRAGRSGAVAESWNSAKALLWDCWRHFAWPSVEFQGNMLLLAVLAQTEAMALLTALVDHFSLLEAPDGFAGTAEWVVLSVWIVLNTLDGVFLVRFGYAQVLKVVSVIYCAGLVLWLFCEFYFPLSSMVDSSFCRWLQQPLALLFYQCRYLLYLCHLTFIVDFAAPEQLGIALAPSAIPTSMSNTTRLVYHLAYRYFVAKLHASFKTLFSSPKPSAHEDSITRVRSTRLSGTPPVESPVADDFSDPILIVQQITAAPIPTLALTAPLTASSTPWTRTPLRPYPADGYVRMDTGTKPSESTHVAPKFEGQSRRALRHCNGVTTTPDPQKEGPLVPASRFTSYSSLFGCVPGPTYYAGGCGRIRKVSTSNHARSSRLQETAAAPWANRAVNAALQRSCFSQPSAHSADFLRYPVRESRSADFVGQSLPGLRERLRRLLVTGAPDEGSGASMKRGAESGSINFSFRTQAYGQDGAASLTSNRRNLGPIEIASVDESATYYMLTTVAAGTTHSSTMFPATASAASGIVARLGYSLMGLGGAAQPAATRALLSPEQRIVFDKIVAKAFLSPTVAVFSLLIATALVVSWTIILPESQVASTNEERFPSMTYVPKSSRNNEVPPSSTCSSSSQRPTLETRTQEKSEPPERLLATAIRQGPNLPLTKRVSVDEEQRPAPVSNFVTINTHSSSPVVISPVAAGSKSAATGMRRRGSAVPHLLLEGVLPLTPSPSGHHQLASASYMSSSPAVGSARGGVPPWSRPALQERLAGGAYSSRAGSHRNRFGATPHGLCGDTRQRQRRRARSGVTAATLLLPSVANSRESSGSPIRKMPTTATPNLFRPIRLRPSSHRLLESTAASSCAEVAGSSAERGDSLEVAAPSAISTVPQDSEEPVNLPLEGRPSWNATSESPSFTRGTPTDGSATREKERPRGYRSLMTELVNSLREICRLSTLTAASLLLVCGWAVWVCQCCIDPLLEETASTTTRFCYWVIHVLGGFFVGRLLCSQRHSLRSNGIFAFVTVFFFQNLAFAIVTYQMYHYQGRGWGSRRRNSFSGAHQTGITKTGIADIDAATVPVILHFVLSVGNGMLRTFAYWMIVASSFKQTHRCLYQLAAAETCFNVGIVAAQCSSMLITLRTQFWTAWVATVVQLPLSLTQILSLDDTPFAIYVEVGGVLLVVNPKQGTWRRSVDRSNITGASDWDIPPLCDDCPPRRRPVKQVSVRRPTTRTVVRAYGSRSKRPVRRDPQTPDHADSDASC